MKTLIWVPFIAFCELTFAQSVSPKVPSSLDTANIFALGPVGYAATTSQEETQFKAILALDQGKAKQKLEQLFESGNPQAMSYALAGMRKLDRKRFAELLLSARVSDLTVETMSGCIGRKQKLSTIASDLDSGKYDLWLF
jgi:hypothetical protein